MSKYLQELFKPDNKMKGKYTKEGYLNPVLEIVCLTRSA